MTLKEKFNIISCNDCDMPYCDIKCTMLSEYELNKLEQISDDYAIEFAEWLSMFAEEFGDLRYWNKDKKIWIRKTIKELLEIFKKEKGL